jgi:N-acetylneuraminate synthase
VDKDAAATGMEPLRGIFTKSVAARMDLPAGTVLSMSNLALKKPGTGIPADRLRDLVGRTLCRPVRAGHFLSEADFEEPVVSPAVA